jgi:hydroxyacid-oxoacid transhydrogenase
MSVILHAPAIFKNLNSKFINEKLFTSSKALDINISKDDYLQMKDNEIGVLISNKLIEYMKLTNMPNGLNGIGFTENEIDVLSSKAFLQKRVINNSPIQISNEKDLNLFYKESMKYW